MTKGFVPSRCKGTGEALSPLAGEWKPGTQATVTLKHLAANLSEAHDMSKRQTEAVLGDLVGLVTKHLKKGDRIRIGGLGILAVRKRAARMERNPGTGDPIQIKASMKGVANVEMTAELATASAYEPAASAYEPSACAQALLRGKEICENDLRATGGSYALEHVETLLGISRQAIDKKVRDDALLAVPGPHARLCELQPKSVRSRRHAPRPVARGVGDPRRPPMRACGGQVSHGRDDAAKVRGAVASPSVGLPFDPAGLGKTARQALDIGRANTGFAQGCLPSGADAHAEFLQERSCFFALETEGRRAGQRIGEARLVSPLADREDETSV
jgi:DNA-binding protein HU-beta